MSTESSDTFVDQLHAKRADELLECILSTLDRDWKFFFITVTTFKTGIFTLLGFMNFLVSFMFTQILVHDVVGCLEFPFLLNAAGRTERVGLLHNIFINEDLIIIFDVCQRYNCFTLTFWYVLIFLFRMWIIISRLFLTWYNQLTFFQTLTLSSTSSYLLHGFFESPDLLVDLMDSFVFVFLFLGCTLDLAK